MGESGGEQQRRRFTQNSTNGQNAAGDHTVDAVGQNHRANDPPLTRAQAESTFPVGLRNGFQTFLGVAHNGGQVHDRQGQCAGHQAGTEVIGEHQHTHQTVNDGRNTGQRLRCIFNDSHYALIGGIFCQIDCCAYAKRQNNQQSRNDNIHGVQNIRQDANIAA